MSVQNTLLKPSPASSAAFNINQLVNSIALFAFKQQLSMETLYNSLSEYEAELEKLLDASKDPEVTTAYKRALDMIQSLEYIVLDKC